MIAIERNKNAYFPNHITVSDNYIISSSTYIGFQSTTSENYGSCILCAGKNTVIFVNDCIFLGNYNIAFATVQCENSTMIRCCFSRNSAIISPDFYYFNKYRSISTFTVSLISLYASKATGSYSHGLGVGTETKSRLRFINQSFCNVKSNSYSAWIIHRNSASIDFDYIYSYSNTHNSLFSSTNSYTSGNKININNFFSMNDQINNLFSSNDAIYNLENCKFIFNKTVVMGVSTNINFDNCYSNILIHDSIIHSPKNTEGNNNAEYCFNNVRQADSVSDIKSKTITLLLFLVSININFL